MNYYEELGIDPSASVEEIRSAYRALARMVHPDHQQDLHYKHLAERQMRRLNEIFEMLSSPEKRKQYDLSLNGSKVPQVIQLLPYPIEPSASWAIWQWISRYGAWGVTAVLGLICLVLLSLGPPTSLHEPSGPRPPPPQVAQAVADIRAHAGASLSSPIAGQNEENIFQNAENGVEYQEQRPPGPRVQSQPKGFPPYNAPGKSARNQSKTSLGHKPPFETAVAPATPLEIIPPQPPEVRQQTSQLEFTTRVNPSAKLAEAGFSGSWFYASNLNDKEDSGLYPPEYIELALTEDEGVLMGHFRARYHITDRAVNPEVAFQIEGRGGPETNVRVGWKSANGAKGIANLKRLTTNSLEMNWHATTLGRQPGLVSGTAVLIRRLER